MCVHHGVLWSCLACAVLQPLSAPAAEIPSTAAQLWELGQQAMRHGLPEQAVRYYLRCLSTDPNFRRSHLSLAAAYLATKDEANACVHLGQYVTAYPDNLSVRAGYAELLARLHHLKDAGTQFERLIADVQDLPESAEESLIPGHTRLMEIAEADEDAYSEHLHRGIGLFLLARRRAAVEQSDDVMPVEGLLCKAAAELTLAALQRPDEARPCWYLYLVWSRLGQRQVALCRLRAADRAAPFTHLTPAEQRNLHLATQAFKSDPAR